MALLLAGQGHGCSGPGPPPWAVGEHGSVCVPGLGHGVGECGVFLVPREGHGPSSPGQGDLSFVSYPPDPSRGSSQPVPEELELLCLQPLTSLNHGFNSEPLSLVMMIAAAH